MYPRPRILPAGDRAVTFEIADAISPEINHRIRALLLALDHQQVPGIVEVVPTYRSLLVYYDPLRLSLSDLTQRLESLEAPGQQMPARAPRVLRVPTHYGGEHGPDLDFVAGHTGLGAAEIARIHSGTDYLVYMMGFNTGFPYLGGMSERIAAPRLPTPRTVIPAGSVGIAQQQTGIYPVESPGGWRLIGRTPIRLFDPARDPPVSVEPGDYIRFVEIDEQIYADIEIQVSTGKYVLDVIEKAD